MNFPSRPASLGYPWIWSAGPGSPKTGTAPLEEASAHPTGLLDAERLGPSILPTRISTDSGSVENASPERCAHPWIGRVSVRRRLWLFSTDSNRQRMVPSFEDVRSATAPVAEPASLVDRVVETYAVRAVAQAGYAACRKSPSCASSARWNAGRAEHRST